MAQQLVLKRALACSSGKWSDDVYDVLADGVIVVGLPRMQNSPRRSRPISWTGAESLPELRGGRCACKR